LKRVISGTIAIPLVLGVVLYGSPLLFFFLVAVIVLIASHEYFSMISKMGVEGFPIEGGAIEFPAPMGFLPGDKISTYFCSPAAFSFVYHLVLQGKKCESGFGPYCLYADGNLLHRGIGRVLSVDT